MIAVRVVYAAVNALGEDKEFARSIEISDVGARRVVDYLMRRGVPETEAQLLGLAYYVGRIHAGAQFGVVLDRLGKA